MTPHPPPRQKYRYQINLLTIWPIAFWQLSAYQLKHRFINWHAPKRGNSFIFDMERFIWIWYLRFQKTPGFHSRRRNPVLQQNLCYHYSEHAWSFLHDVRSVVSYPTSTCQNSIYFFPLFNFWRLIQMASLLGSFSGCAPTSNFDLFHLGGHINEVLLSCDMNSAL